MITNHHKPSSLTAVLNSVYYTLADARLRWIALTSQNKQQVNIDWLIISLVND